MLEFLALPYWRHKEKLAHKHEQEIKEKCELTEKQLDKIAHYRFNAWVMSVRAQKELDNLKKAASQSDLATNKAYEEASKRLSNARHAIAIAHKAKKRVLSERESLQKELDSIQQEVVAITSHIQSLQENRDNAD